MGECIRYSKDEDNIVTLVLDMPGRAVNVVNDELSEDFAAVVERLVADKPLAGVIVASAKKTFVAGAEVGWLYEQRDPEVLFHKVEAAKALFRKLETLGVPVVAAVNGAALGGGLEVALACHHRVAIDDPKAKIGFPEVTLGLLPGAGGITRVTRMLGLQAAFPYFSEGTQVDPRKAKDAGLIDELAADREEMMARARAWILANPTATQPWDRPGYKMPGGSPTSPSVAQVLAIAPAMVMKKTYGNYPAAEGIISAMTEGAVVDFDTASRIESRYFARVATGQVAKNMITAFWFQLNDINGGGSRPAGIEPMPTEKVGVLGAGLMGHGIAYSTARAGMQVVLKDVTPERAEAGKARIEALLARDVSRGRLGEAEKAAALDRITPTGSAQDLKGCDLIIEAVFEDREVKAEATREAEAQIAGDAVIGSNTSTLPITGLAECTVRPENFIGIHFFSPVPKMRLVEIIVGKQTSPRTLAKAFDYVLKIRKTPIVVNDSRGFYTSRVFGTYLIEGVKLLAEGQNPRAVESAGLKAGMPMGPLEVADMVGLGLVVHIREQTERDMAAEGKTLPPEPAQDLVAMMVKEKGRTGQSGGAGFYDYTGGEKRLWPELAQLVPPAQAKLSQAEMIERLMFIQALETVRCVEEKVITSVADANIGSIFGWGFAPFKGGTLQYINAYGLPGFVARCHDLAARYGDRFAPPALLVEMAEAGKTF